MPYADADGIKLYYEETGSAGSGDPIIFAHEFAGDLRSWEPQLRYFARRYRCIAFNARGFPPSDVPDDVGAYSQTAATDDIAHVLNHLGIARAHVVGLSMGAFAALHFGLRYPRMAVSLVVAGGGYGALPTNHLQFQQEAQVAADRFERLGAAGVAESYGAAPARLPLQRKDPRGYAEFLQQLAGHSTLGSTLTLRGCQATRPAFTEFEADLRRMMVPLLVVAGDEDEPSLEPSLYLKRTVPSAALCLLPKSGHALNLEEPALFNRILGDFLATVSAGRWQERELPASGDKII